MKTQIDIVVNPTDIIGRTYKDGETFDCNGILYKVHHTRNLQ